MRESYLGVLGREPDEGAGRSMPNRCGKAGGWARCSGAGRIGRALAAASGPAYRGSACGRATWGIWAASRTKLGGGGLCRTDAGRPGAGRGCSGAGRIGRALAAARMGRPMSWCGRATLVYWAASRTKRASRLCRAAALGSGVGRGPAELAESDEHWRLQVGRHADELVRESYLGVLGPGAGRRKGVAHAERLRSGATLGEVLSDLTDSEEHWRNGVAQRAEQLVDELYRTLLGREADIRGIESYSEYLRSARGFEVVAASLIRSEEFYRRFTRINRNRLVKDIYSATYGVQPSQLVMTAFLEYFQAFSTDSVGQIIEAVQKLPSLSNNSANDKRGFAVVIIPNKVWLVTALSSAKQLYDNEGIKSVVLLGGMFVDETYFSRLNFVVAFCVHDDFIKNHASRFDVSIIIGHADNVDREIENLIGLFPTAQVRCFSDGYRNSAHGFGVSKFKAVDHAVRFRILIPEKQRFVSRRILYKLLETVLTMS